MADGVTTSATTRGAPSRASESGTGAQQQDRLDTEMYAEEKQEEQEDDNDMPLLFMDRLPSDFSTNEQLAAIATFMDDSDTEQQRDDDGNDDDYDSNDAERHTTRGMMRQAVRRRSARRRRKQAPYTKEKKRDTTSANDLTLFMNFFKM